MGGVTFVFGGCTDNRRRFELKEPLLDNVLFAAANALADLAESAVYLFDGVLAVNGLAFKPAILLCTTVGPPSGCPEITAGGTEIFIFSIVTPVS